MTRTSRCGKRSGTVRCQQLRRVDQTSLPQTMLEAVATTQTSTLDHNCWGARDIISDLWEPPGLVDQAGDRLLHSVRNTPAMFLLT
jgi:hypothetical protein